MTKECRISPLASVSPGAQLGSGVSIGAFAVVEDNVQIGDDCSIANGATICWGTRLGSRNRVFQNAVVGGIPQDLKFRGEETTCEIGDDNTIRECATVNRGTASKGRTVVGNHNLLMAYSHIGHDCVLGNELIISNAVQMAGEVTVMDHAVIGGGVLIHQFTRVGRYVMVQGGTRFGKDAVPFALVGREPAAVEGVNVVGMKRHGFTPEQMEEVQAVIRYLYNSNLNVTQAVARMEAELTMTPLVEEMLQFVKTSQRGLLRG